MAIIGWIVLGLIAGAVAESILEPGLRRRWLTALGLGVAGSLVGGLVAMTLFRSSAVSQWSIEAWLLAAAGAMAALLIYGRITRATA